MIRWLEVNLFVFQAVKESGGGGEDGVIGSDSEDEIDDREDLLLDIKDRRESKAALDRSQLDSSSYLERLRHNNIPNNLDNIPDDK